MVEQVLMSVVNNNRVIWEMVCIDLCNVCVPFNCGDLVLIAPKFAIAPNACVKVKNSYW